MAFPGYERLIPVSWRGRDYATDLEWAKKRLEYISHPENSPPLPDFSHLDKDKAKGEDEKSEPKASSTWVG